MPKEKKSKKTMWKTLSIPRGLADDIQKVIDEFGYWPSLGSFVREAAIEKMKREREFPGKIVEEPIIALSPEKRDR